MRALMLSAQCGEWEGLYIDGYLVAEGHTLGEGKVPKFWLGIAERYHIIYTDIVMMDTNDADEKLLCDSGSLPDMLEELSGAYI